jgi:solute carrier family 35 (UDP-galactose transporter), member B1
MARSKQVTPMRRETSTEYFSRHNSASKRGGDATNQSNGKAASGSLADDLAVDKKDAGVLQLAIAVGGIYASL